MSGRSEKLYVLIGSDSIKAYRLMDKNGKFWVNNGKPWLGISLGLNLN